MWFFKYLSRWPMQRLYWLADFLFWLMYRLIGYRKKLVLSNLTSSFPEKTPAEIQQIAKDFYRQLADVIVEIIKLPGFSALEIQERMQIENIELLQHYQAQNHPVLAFGAHYANWEWVSSGLTRRGVASEAVYKPLTDRLSEKLMRHIRTAHGPSIVPIQRVTRELVARRNQFRVVGLVGDQSPHDPQFAYWLPFLGQRTSFFTGLEKLAVSMKMPVVYVEVIRQKRGYYVARFSLIAEPPYQNIAPESITTACKNKLEQIIRQKPADWLWSHDRWKWNRL